MASVSACMQTREAMHLAYAQHLDSKAALRACCLHDLFFLMVYVLQRKDMDNDWCFARCREVEAQPNGYIDLWAREHYKSTIITIGKTIQDLLRNPELTVGIFSHTRPIAKSFLAQIKRTFEQNKLLQELFPDVLWQYPKRESPKWSEDTGLIVKRKNNPKEASVEAWGLVDGQPTGKHFSLLVYDDVVTQDSVRTPEMIRKVTESWALSLNLGSQGGAMRIIGTRYHANDTYREILRRKAARARVYSATSNGKIDGEPVFMPKSVLEQKYKAMGSYVFSCQMLQNPLADSSQGFKEESLRFWSGSIAKSNYYLLVDPANSKKSQADYTAMWIVALAEDNNIYLVDGLRDKLNLTERTQALFDFHRKYRPLYTGYERYGMQADIEHILYVQNQEGYRFPIQELGGSMSKVERIKRLVPAFEQARIYLPKSLFKVSQEGRTYNLTELFIQDEYSCFPVGSHDDMLDCLSRIYDLPLRFPSSREKKESLAVQQVKTQYNVANYGVEEHYDTTTAF